VDVQIRVARDDEADVLAGLSRRVALAAYGHIFPPEAPPPTHDQMLARWRHWLGPDRATGRRAFVAESDGAADGVTPVIGVVLAGPDPDEPAVGHLARLNVEAEHWDHGIGSQLYAVALDHLRTLGFAEATLWVLEHNTRARAWYERLGWTATGERQPMYTPAGIDDLRYRRRLDT
jgi:ribosomal protein S18 acetylase RimI-like enzyme